MQICNYIPSIERHVYLPFDNTTDFYTTKVVLYVRTGAVFARIAIWPIYGACRVSYFAPKIIAEHKEGIYCTIVLHRIETVAVKNEEDANCAEV